MQMEDAEIAVAAIEATINPERWHDLCDVVAGRLSTQAFMLQEYNPVEHTAPIFYASSRMRTGDGAALLAKMVEGHQDAAEDKPGYDALATTTSGTVIGEGEAFGFDHSGPPSDNSFRDRVLSATGGTSRSAMRLNHIGPWMDVAVTVDKQSDYRASESFKRYAPALSVILHKALESKRLISRLSQNYTVLLNLFDWLKFGVGFFDDGGGILIVNDKLQRWINEQDAVVKVKNRLEAAVASEKPALRAALAGNALTQLGPKATTLSLKKRSNGTPLVVHIVPVKDKSIHLERVSMAFFLDPNEKQQITAEGLAVIGNLTHAELDICNLLLRGLSTASVSEHRGTGLETVRGQVKKIMHKLECRQRLDLVRLAMVTSPDLIILENKNGK